MASAISDEEKKLVRELAGDWLEIEKTWTQSYRFRVLLSALVLPFYYLHGILYGMVSILIILCSLIVLMLMCFVVCFRLDPLLRYCVRKCFCDEPPKEDDEETKEAKRQQIIAAGGDPAEQELKDDFEIMCLTRFQRKMFQEQLWSKLVLFSPGRFLIAKKLEVLRQKCEALLRERSGHTYVIPKETVLKLTEWPKHEQALAQNMLAKTDIIKIKPPQSGARIFSPVLFVSHKWNGNQCDNEKNEILEQVKERLNTTPKSYVWFDCTLKCIVGCCNEPSFTNRKPIKRLDASVPQEDAVQRMLHLRSIPEIISRSEVGIFLHKSEPEMAEKYMKSIWCQLEFVLSGLDMKNQKERDWTIFDCNDLYLILPAFISMTCKKQNYSEIFGGIRTTGGHAVFGQILRFFVKWHDEQAAKQVDSPV